MKLLFKLVPDTACHKLFRLMILVTLLQACAPQTKEAYMEDYRDFIEEVKRNYEHFTPEDWQKYDKEFQKYSKDYYKKFEEEMTLKDKLILEKYAMEYKLFRYGKTAKDFLEILFENGDELKQKVQYYQEHEMQQDLEELAKEAEELGQEAEKMLNDILEELNQAKP